MNKKDFNKNKFYFWIKTIKVEENYRYSQFYSYRRISKSISYRKNGTIKK